MSLLHIANFEDAPRTTCVAGADLTLGQVIKIAADANGERRAAAVADADAALLVFGNYGVAFKVDNEMLQVSTSTAPAFWGDRVVKIRSGDLINQVERGAILEYDPALLHSSLDPARGGTLPAIGAALGVKDGLFSTSGTAGAITSPVVGRVHDTLGGKVRIKLV